MKLLATIVIVGIIAGLLWYYGFLDIKSIPIPESFKSRLAEINTKFDTMKADFEKGIINEKAYKQSLDELLKKQDKLYSDVKNYTWSDSQINEYAGWTRGIMKFPSSIEQEYQKHFK